MATVLDIIQGISQAAANAYDGSHIEEYSHDGKVRKVGLKREEGNPILDSRVMDGFNVKYYGDSLCIEYHGETKLKEVHNRNKFEGEINTMLNNIKKYLQKEYKSITNNSLSLTKEGESNILVQHMSNIRTWVQAKQFYKIGGLKGVEPLCAESDKDRLDDAVKKWISLGNGPKPKNVTRKKEQ